MSALHQATGVAIGGRAVLIEGPPSSGKSSLALALIDRDAVLVGDDGVALELREGRLWAGPPSNIAGKLEIRNVGIVDLPATEAPVALVIRLNEDAPRHIEAAEQAELLGCTLPLIRLWPGAAALPLRAEWALRLYGLA